MSNDTTPAYWAADPTGRYEQRYWDGAVWTEHVYSGGMQSVDALAGSAAQQDSASPQLRRDRRMIADAATLPASKVPFFGARRKARDLQEEVASLQDLIVKYGLRDLVALDAAKADVAAQTERMQVELQHGQSQLESATNERRRLAADILDLRNAVEIQEQGLYDFEHPAEDSVAIGTELIALRARIKSAVSAGAATSATSNFTFNDSSAAGRRFVRDMSKLMLRSYNAEAENCVKAVKAGNLYVAQARLTKAMEQIERLGKMIDLHITPSYHKLRLKELEYANRHLRAVQAEKEADRAHREELREQAKAEKELQAEKVRLEKERTHYLNTISALRDKGDDAGVERMLVRLADVDHAIENVDYRAANIRAGFVYVISNVGSFGTEVVKIGLTRRLEPMDRVRELGDASVPFRFDVHALFFADDAVGIEAMLHQHFADRRINRVNMRREYFRATPQEVRAALKEHSVELLDFKIEPAAEEYRFSEAARGTVVPAIAGAPEPAQ
ncbi:MAG: DUF4041 domain-containing protein [Actinomycetota bacterium]